jgi:hypothetical protein
MDQLADAELNQQGISQQTTNDIISIKADAARLLARGGEELAESMQAVTDYLSS